MNRLIRWGRNVLMMGPPLAFFTWGARLLAKVYSYQIPAFGPVDLHLRAYRSQLVGDAIVGGVILALWVTIWAFVRRVDSSGGRRRVNRRGRPRALRRPGTLPDQARRSPRQSLRSVD